ncbi:MAG: hypothetical protein P8Y24_00110 [Gammaproteobacteria bacterium]|jgi:hypothetical protein
MTLPKPVYESIPALYVITGIIAISAVDSFISFISGILMGGSGIAIMCLRRNYRVKKELEQINV